MMHTAIALSDILAAFPRLAPYGFSDSDQDDLTQTWPNDSRTYMLQPGPILRFAQLVDDLGLPAVRQYFRRNRGIRLHELADVMGGGTGTVLAALLASGYSVRQIGLSTDGVIGAP